MSEGEGRWGDKNGDNWAEGQDWEEGLVGGADGGEAEEARQEDKEEETEEPEEEDYNWYLSSYFILWRTWACTWRGMSTASSSSKGMISLTQLPHQDN